MDTQIFIMWAGTIGRDLYFTSFSSHLTYIKIHSNNNNNIQKKFWIWAMTMDDYDDDDDHCLPSHVRDKSSITRVEYEIFFLETSWYMIALTPFFICLFFPSSFHVSKKSLYNLAVCYCLTLFYWISNYDRHCVCLLFLGELFGC